MGNGETIDTKTINSIELELKYTKNKQARQVFNSSKSQELVYQYSLKVDYNNKSKSFNYYGSIQDFKKDKFSKAMEAFNSILLDARSYDRVKDRDQFADEFGISKPTQVNEAYTACQNTYKDLKKLGIKDIYKLQEKTGV